MALRPQIINLVRLDRPDQPRQSAGVGQVAVVQNETISLRMQILVYRLQSARIERTGPPNNPVDLVSFGQEQFRQVGTILAGNPSDQSPFHDIQLAGKSAQITKTEKLPAVLFGSGSFIGFP